MSNYKIVVDHSEGIVNRIYEGGTVKHAIGGKTNGYLFANINKKKVYLHRFIYEDFHGPIPDGLFIDHINMVRHDNRIENLRLVTGSQNQQNRLCQKNSTTGAKGVSWHKGKCKFMAKIKLHGKASHLGYFDTIEEAKTAYAVAASKLHTHNPVVRQEVFQC